MSEAQCVGDTYKQYDPPVAHRDAMSVKYLIQRQFLCSDGYHVLRHDDLIIIFNASPPIVKSQTPQPSVYL